MHVAVNGHGIAVGNVYCEFQGVACKELSRTIYVSQKFVVYDEGNIFHQMCYAYFLAHIRCGGTEFAELAQIQLRRKAAEAQRHSAWCVAFA